MRGKAEAGLVTRVDGGITPAHAGKSLNAVRTTLEVKDHPRACGEKQILLGVSPVNQGSPPRMRGKVALHLLKLAQLGITPAHAGKRLDFLSISRYFSLFWVSFKASFFNLP